MQGGRMGRMGMEGGRSRGGMTTFSWGGGQSGSVTRGNFEHCFPDLPTPRGKRPIGPRLLRAQVLLFTHFVRRRASSLHSCCAH